MRSRSDDRWAMAGVSWRSGRTRLLRSLGAAGLCTIAVVSVVVARPLVALGQSTDQQSVAVPPEVVAKASTNGEARVIVQLAAQGDASSNAATGHQLLADVGEQAPDAHVLGGLGVVALTASPAQLKDLSRSKLVSRIEPDTLLAPAADGDSTARIGAPAAWAGNIRGDGQTVALIDSGVDTTHPALQGKVVYEACFSNNSCPNGLASETNVAGAARPCTYGLSCEHGTHVAGIIAGNAGNLSGVAPAANLIAIQVFSRSDSPADCGAATPCPRARTSDVLAALDHVYELRTSFPNLVAVNMSLSSDSASAGCDTSILAGSVNKLRSVNIATVVASGNGGATNGLGVPACISSTISVAATYADHDAVWPSSNVSPALTLLAPGVAINSPAPGGGYSPTTGTSAAAPHVAGAWALVAQKLATHDVGTILNFLQSKGVTVSYTLPDGSVLQKPRIDVSSLGSSSTLSPVTTITVGQGGPNPCVGCVPVSGNFNGDGKAGILWYGKGRGNTLWTSTGDGKFTSSPLPNMPDGYQPLVGDFDGDGKADVFWYAVGGGTNLLWLSTGNGQFTSSTAPPIFPNLKPFVGDFNGDKYDDIFWYAPGWQNSWIFYGGPGARFGGVLAPFVGGNYTPVPGDFDGDGKTDIMWFNPSGTDWVWRSLGNGNFSGDYAPQIDGNYTPAAGDFNGDGKTDIYWYGGARGPGWLWTALGNMRFGGVQYLINSNDSYVPLTGDFTGNKHYSLYLYGQGRAADRLLSSF